MSRVRVTALAALTAVALLAFLLRVPSIAEPLGIDQGLFASGAHALSRGYALYRDVWDQKPPAIFLTYLAAFRIFGWAPPAIGWLDILASAATTWFLFASVRRLDGAVSGAVTAALYAALTMPSWLYRHGGFLERSVPETFISASVAFAAWCAIQLVLELRTPDPGPRPPLRPAISLGLASGVAIAFKPNAGLYLPALVGWVVWFAPKGAPLVRLVGLVAVAATVAPVLSVLWIWQHSALADARVALVDFNRFYVAASYAGQEGRPYIIEFAKAVWLRIKTDPLWAAGAVGGLVAAWDLLRTRRLDPWPALALLWGAAAAVVVILNGAWLFNTYFVQTLPPLAVLAAWGLAGAGRHSNARKLAAIAAMTVMAILLVWRNYPSHILDSASADVQRWRGRGDVTAYLERFGGYGTGGGYSARANAEVAIYIRERTTRDDLIFQFGINSAGVYFATDRLPAQRFLRVNEFVPATFPTPGFDLASVARELAARRPVYLIFEELHGRTEMARAVDRLQDAPELQPLLSAYRRERQIEDYTLYRRRSTDDGDRGTTVIEGRR